MFKTDSFFSIGASHDICQDYSSALSTVEENPKGMIFISDGCSMIATNDNHCVPHPSSDIAARLVILAAMASMLDCKYITQAVDQIKGILKGFTEATTFGMLDATLIGVRWINKPEILWIGDGAILVETEREYIIKYRTFSPNMPVYCSYLVKYFQGEKYIKTGVEMTTNTITLDKTWDVIASGNKVEKLKTLEDSMFIDAEENTTHDIISISAFSDGIEDILLPSKDRMPIIDAIKTLVSFKHTSGLFVRRRMKAQLRRWASEDIFPNDDLSMATIIHNV